MVPFKVDLSNKVVAITGASAFFSGQKSLDEVIMIIENRADTLFSERE